MRPSSKEAFARLMILKFVIVHGLSTPPPSMLAESMKSWTSADRDDFDKKFRSEALKMVESLNKLGLWNYASPKEKKFLEKSGSQISEQEIIDATWRTEAAGMLLWAFRMIPACPAIDQQLDSEIIINVKIQKLGFLPNHPRLRNYVEISEKRDVLEFWHWRVRTWTLVKENRPLEVVPEMKKLGLTSHDNIVRFSAKMAYEKGTLSNIKDEDFVFLGKPFRSLNEDEHEIASSIISERHRALNWLCGRAPENRWDDTPTDT